MRNDLQLRILTAIAWGIAFGWAAGYLTDSPAFGPALVAIVLTVWSFWPKKWRKQPQHRCEWCGGKHPTREHRK